MTGDANRTDDQELRQDVLSALSSDQRIVSIKLRVGVLNAIVHLGGSAASTEQWRRAEQVARNVPGVRGVVNRIEAPGAPSPARSIHLNLDD